MPTMGSSSTQNQVAPVNSTLNNMFTNLFGSGGAGATGVGTLTSFAKGGNVGALNDSLTKSNASTFSGTIGKLKEAFGSTGMGSSSSLAKIISQAGVDNSNNLTSSLASADLTASRESLSAGNFLAQIFSSAATSYFNSKSEKESSSFNPTTLFSALFPGGA